MRKALLMGNEPGDKSINDPLPGCVNLLRAMELFESDEESDLLDPGDGGVIEESSTLPSEWLCPDLGLVSIVPEDVGDNSQSSVMQWDNNDIPCVAPKEKKLRVEKKKWGLVEIEKRNTRGTMMGDLCWRRPRISRESGMKVMAKVQNLHLPLLLALV